MSGRNRKNTNPRPPVRRSPFRTNTLPPGVTSGAALPIDLSSGSQVTNRLPLANVAQGSALSVLGVAGNATADHADIVAGSDGQVFRRAGAAVGFGAVDLANANARTGKLPYANIADVSGPSKILGRKSGGAGVIEELTVSDLVAFATGGVSLIDFVADTWAAWLAGATNIVSAIGAPNPSTAASGSATNDFQPDGKYIALTTSAVSGQSAVFNSGTPTPQVYSSDFDWTLEWVIRTGADITNFRLYIGLTGKPFARLMRTIPTRYYVAPLLTFAVLAWGWKIFIHLRGMDGW